jgi:hypothetical protein
MIAVGAELERRFAQKRFKIFLQVQSVQENFAVNELRLEAEIDFRPVPRRPRLPMAQNHYAVGRADRHKSSPACRTKNAAR